MKEETLTTQFVQALPALKPAVLIHIASGASRLRRRLTGGRNRRAKRSVPKRGQDLRITLTNHVASWT